MYDLPYERILLGVCGVAAMENALKMTIEYTKDRTVFEQKLFEA